LSGLRVLFVAQDDFSAPSELHVLGFAEELARRGHEVMISVGGDPASAGREGLTVPAGVRVDRHVFSGRSLSSDTLARAMEFSPDIIHSWIPRVPSMSATRAYARATGAPHVVHFEDDEWRKWPVGSHDVRGWLNLARRRATWRLHPPKWVRSTPTTLRWVKRDAAGVDALTPSLAHEVERQLGRPCAVVLPVLPTRVEQDGKSVLGRNGGERIVLFTGRVMASSLPDFDCAMAAVAEVRRRGTVVRLVQTGLIDPAIDLRSRARSARLDEGGLTLIGHIPFANIEPTLRDADVLLQSGPRTRFNKLRLPSKLQSYLASGTPTVTFAIGLEDLLRDREEVLMTYTDDPSELADRLLEALFDSDLRARLAAGGPAAAQRLFDPVRNTDALLAYYDSALGRSR
jgi:glycosyltransferase involved in cell wall biosynthesis